MTGDIRKQVDAAVAEGRLTEDLWDIERASAFLGVPVGTLYQWRSSGTGPRSYKAGNSVKYDPYDLRAYLLGNVKEPAA